MEWLKVWALRSSLSTEKKKILTLLGIVRHACDSNTQEAGGSRVSKLYSKFKTSLAM
jgi:hypothetical protein